MNKKFSRILLRNYLKEHTLFCHRTRSAFLIVLLLTGVLYFHLYKLQIIEYSQYHASATGNCIKMVPIKPARGQIYDRNGILLADNRTVPMLQMSARWSRQQTNLRHSLLPMLDLNEYELTQIHARSKQAKPYEQIVIKKDLTPEELAQFAVNQHQFPHLSIATELRRYYPFRENFAHVLGYLGSITESDLHELSRTLRTEQYLASTKIGRMGIEAYYESVLHGTPGMEKIEINNHGQPVRLMETIAPKPGASLFLSMDSGLQCYCMELLKAKKGSIIVANPQNGEILALCSSPSYNPNQFVDGLSNTAYKHLLDDPALPLFNRATQGLYPPASTIKPFIAIAALQEKIITATTSRNDPGWWELPGTTKRYRDWKRWGHGAVNLGRALSVSSDTFFYQLAYELGIDRLASWMKEFGFGNYSGIDLKEENIGLMPDRQWKLKKFGIPWYHGDTIPVGIGQGYWVATPMQLLHALIRLIHNGQESPPPLHLVRGEPWETRNAERCKLRKKSTAILAEPQHWACVKQGMRAAAHSQDGTIRNAFHNCAYKVGVKSGTAQVFGLKTNQRYSSKDLAQHLHDHALLIGFAPYEAPTIAVSIVLEHGGAGSAQAGPIARKIFDYVLSRPNFSITASLECLTTDKSSE